uniref:C-type lectin domain-containing protein n=1 Tax=Leptobrachium leishanense TaxID=445787 RepID=A0A8C5QGN8_9ANUR
MICSQLFSLSQSYFVFFPLLLTLLSATWQQCCEDTVCYHHTGNCYTVQSKKLAFIDANAACGPKSSLTSMKDEQEVSEIVQLVNRLQHKLDFLYWIGLSRQNKECVDLKKTLYGYSWISGGDYSKVDFWTEVPKITCVKKRCVALQKWDVVAVIGINPYCGLLD